jgi:hypothetical protein
MATITTIAAADKIGDSRADINDNFDNLNTDKLEAVSVTEGDLTGDGTSGDALTLAEVSTAGTYDPISMTIDAKGRVTGVTEYFSLPSADTTATGIKTTETVGESVAFGDILYLKSDGKWWKSDADAATTMPALRMALATASADATCLMLCQGWARNDAWSFTVGGILYASATAGAMTQTQPDGCGDQVQTVGVAYHADKVWFAPSLVLVEVE